MLTSDTSLKSQKLSVGEKDMQEAALITDIKRRSVINSINKGILNFRRQIAKFRNEGYLADLSCDAEERILPQLERRPISNYVAFDVVD